MKLYRTFFLIAFLFFMACGRKNKGTQESFQASLASGSELFAKYGCTTCHSRDGTEMYGPALDGLFMKEVSVIRDGRIRILKADEKYLSRAIGNPSYEKVLGYETRTMPVPDITKEDIELLVDYLRELDER